MQFRSDIFWKCARGGCPDCGAEIRPAADKSTGLARLWNIPDRCPECGMELRRREGFFLGAMVWNYALTAFGVLPLLLLAYRLDWIDWTWTVRLIIASALLIPPLIHAFSWRLWIGTYYAFLPEQLPSNGRRTDD